MAITFNNFEDATSVTYYPSGGGSTNRYISNAWSDGDIFPDAFSAGDYIVFDLTKPTDTVRVRSGLKINVTTAISASAVDIIWEYQGPSSSWVSLEGLSSFVDNTADFSVTGLNTVDFDPAEMTSVWWNGMIRARVVSVTSPTEGGAFNTSVKPQAGDYAITVSGQTATPEHLYTAMISGGWYTVMTSLQKYLKAGFEMSCDLKIVSSSTFNIIDCALHKTSYANGTRWQPLIDVDSSSTWTMGQKNASGFGYNGGDLIVSSPAGYYHAINFAGKFYCYASRINIYNGNCSIVLPDSSDVEAYDSNFEGLWRFQYPRSANITVPFYRCKWIFDYSAKNGQSEVLFNKSYTYTFVEPYVYNGGYWTSDNSYIILLRSNGVNPKFEARGIRTIRDRNPKWLGTPQYNHTGAPGAIYHELSWDINVVDENDDPIEGATVTVTNNVPAQVFSVSTDANGDITQQWVANTYKVSGASAVDYFPFVLKIEKTGYETIEIEVNPAPTLSGGAYTAQPEPVKQKMVMFAEGSGGGISSAYIS